MDEPSVRTTKKPPIRVSQLLSLIGLCWCDIMNTGYIRSIGIFYLAFLDLFNRGPVLTSMIHSVQAIMAAITAPVTGLLLQRFQVRTLICFASLLETVGSIISGFARHIEVIFLSYSVMWGVGTMINFNSALVQLNRTFKDRPTLFTGIWSTVGSLGGMAIPPLVAYLMEVYTVRGVFFILGGMWLNQVVSALLQRSDLGKENTGPVSLHQTEDDIPLQEIQLTGDNSAAAKFKDGDEIPISRGPNITVDTQGTVKVEEGDRKKGPNQETEVKLLGTEQKAAKDVSPTPKGLMLFVYMYKNIHFILGAFFVSCVSMSLFLFNLAGPAFAAEKGFSKFDVSVLLSISAGCSLVSRFTFGLVADLKFVNKDFFIAGLLVLPAVFSVLFPYVASTGTIYAYFVLFGPVLDTLFISLGHIVRRCHKVEFIAVGMGILTTHYAISGFIASAVMGVLAQSTGTYASSLQLAGILTLVACAILIVSSLSGRCCSKFGLTHVSS